MVHNKTSSKSTDILLSSQKKADSEVDEIEPIRYSPPASPAGNE